MLYSHVDSCQCQCPAASNTKAGIPSAFKIETYQNVHQLEEQLKQLESVPGAHGSRNRLVSHCMHYFIFGGQQGYKRVDARNHGHT